MAKKRKLDRRSQTIINYKQNGGNLMKAMIDAGYSESYANKNSQYLWGIIGPQIAEEQKAIKSEKIKTVAEVQERWSEWMDNDELTYSERIKCSELLAKSQGGFIDKLEVKGQVNNPFDGLTTAELKKLVNSG